MRHKECLLYAASRLSIKCILYIKGNPGEGFPLFNRITIENSPILRFADAKKGFAPAGATRGAAS